MATTMDEQRKELVEWRASLLVKDKKVNAGKTKLMVSGVVSELGAWPCGVSSKGVAANSLQYEMGPHEV